MILGIDTSADQCAVALVGDGKLWQRSEAMTRGHADALIPMIEAVLQEAGAVFGDVTRIAVCTGPGSFTGIRAGIAAARGLALGLDVPAIGISRLELLAEAQAGEVAVPLRGRNWAVQMFSGDGPEGAPSLQERGEISAGDLTAALPDPATIARLGAQATPGGRPAPLYLRPADAAPPSEQPAPILDP